MPKDEFPPSGEAVLLPENTSIDAVFSRRPTEEKRLDSAGAEKIVTDDLYKLGGIGLGLAEAKNAEYFSGLSTLYGDNEPNIADFERNLINFLDSETFEVRLLPIKDNMPLMEDPPQFRILVSSENLSFAGAVPIGDVARIFTMEFGDGFEITQESFDEVAKAAYQQVVKQENLNESAANYLNFYRTIDGLWKKAAGAYNPNKSPNPLDFMDSIMQKYVVAGKKIQGAEDGFLSTFVFSNDSLPELLDDITVSLDASAPRIGGPGEEYFVARKVVGAIVDSMESALAEAPANRLDETKKVEVSNANDQLMWLCENSRMNLPLLRSIMFPLAKSIASQGKEYADWVREAAMHTSLGGEGVIEVWEEWGLKFGKPDHKRMADEVSPFSE